MSIYMHPTRSIVLYAVCCIGSIVLNLLCFGLGSAFLWAIFVAAFIASFSSPLAAYANAVYDLLTERRHYVLWGIGYGLTLLPHVIYLGFFFGVNLLGYAYFWVLFGLAVSHLLFPLIYWPIVISKRRARSHVSIIKG